MAKPELNKQEELDELYFAADALADAGNYAKAFEMWMQGAAQGDDVAQNRLGYAYSSGEGVEVDYVKALFWYKKAWRTSKDPSHFNNIAIAYDDLGNRRRARYYWERAIAARKEDGDIAYHFAKFLMKTKRGKPSPRILELLRMAVSCVDGAEITPAGKEEARKLLKNVSSQA